MACLNLLNQAQLVVFTAFAKMSRIFDNNQSVESSISQIKIVKFAGRILYHWPPTWSMTTSVFLCIGFIVEWGHDLTSLRKKKRVGVLSFGGAASSDRWSFCRPALVLFDSKFQPPRYSLQLGVNGCSIHQIVMRIKILLVFQRIN